MYVNSIGKQTRANGPVLQSICCLGAGLGALLIRLDLRHSGMVPVGRGAGVNKVPENEDSTSSPSTLDVNFS